MLIQDFYRVLKIDKIIDNQYAIDIELNKNHPIFAAHFPNRPITPGVMVMQIIKELTEMVLSKQISLLMVNNVRFLAIINPQISTSLTIQLTLSSADEKGQFTLKNTCEFEGKTAVKLSNTYQIL